MAKLPFRMVNKARLWIHFRFDNFVFVHINKTGGSSIEKALGIPLYHETAMQIIKKLGHNEWNKKVSFTVIRNPWDKVVSHYFYRVQTNQTNLAVQPIDFNTWVRLSYGEKNRKYYDKPKMFMPQIDWITDPNGKILVSEILRFENLQNDFQRLLLKIGRSATLTHIKKSSRGDYKSYYESDTIEIVREHFRKDIETFGYTF